MQSIKQLRKQNAYLSLFRITQQGFTLLEIMLALVIIAIITSFSIGIFQQQAVNAQIDKTALQMQQWLEAAKAFYVTNDVWPNGYDSKYNCTSMYKDKFTNYLLEGACGDPSHPPPYTAYIQAGSIDVNAWGQGFTLIPPSGASRIFQVQTSIPGNLKNSAALAQRLASRLPNAVVNGTQVTAGITIPGAASNSGVIIKSIIDVYCPAGSPLCATQVPKLDPKDCPQGMVPNIHVALRNVTLPNSVSVDKLSNISMQVLPMWYDKYPNTQSWQPAVNVNGSTQGVLHQGSVLAIVTCERPPSNKQTKTTNSNFTY